MTTRYRRVNLKVDDRFSNVHFVGIHTVRLVVLDATINRSGIVSVAVCLLGLCITRDVIDASFCCYFVVFVELPVSDEPE